jgi:hypothetical protein
LGLLEGDEAYLAAAVERDGRERGLAGDRDASTAVDCQGARGLLESRDRRAATTRDPDRLKADNVARKNDPSTPMDDWRGLRLLE